MDTPYLIPFHQPTYIGKELAYVRQAMSDGNWVLENRESLAFFKSYYPDSTCFFVNSCSSALEMAVQVLEIGKGDEVIIPGFGYVAVANAVVNKGATPIYADVHLANGNIDVQSIEECISPRTKAVIGIHYAGNPFDVFRITQLCKDKNIYLIEDAAQAMGSSYLNNPLGSFGHLSCLSFDYMKNITCGQGGLLIVNDKTLLQKVQTLYDNGTNKKALLQGTQKDFDWVSTGHNFYINPIATHFLSSQLNDVHEIISSRRSKWNLYLQLLQPLLDSGKLSLPVCEATHNGHIFYLVTNSEKERTSLRDYLKTRGIFTEQHYSFLPESSFGKKTSEINLLLPNSRKLCGQLLRLPLWHEIPKINIEAVVDNIKVFYGTPGTVNQKS